MMRAERGSNIGNFIMYRGIHELKNRLSPLSTTGMNSSSSSSGSDSSDSDSDTDSSSGSEMTTPSNTPIKNATTTAPATTVREPTTLQDML